MKKNVLILEVLENKANGHRYVTIPRRKGIEPGTYVMVEPIRESDTNEKGVG